MVTPINKPIKKFLKLFSLRIEPDSLDVSSLKAGGDSQFYSFCFHPDRTQDLRHRVSAHLAEISMRPFSWLASVEVSSDEKGDRP